MYKRLFILIFLITVLISGIDAHGPDAHGLAASSSDPDLQAEIESKLDLGNSNVEQTAVTMARDYPGEFSINQVSAIYGSLVKGWYYYNDPIYKESYKNANKTLQDGKIAGTVGVGDCDDFAILISSLIQSLGGSTRIVFAQDEETGMGHAYAELYLGKKDSPLIDDIKSWIKDEYGAASIMGLDDSGEDTWLNLDYNSSYPGGPYFGGVSDKVSRKIVWESQSKSFPKIVPVIDSMDSIAGWKTISDENGSNISLSSVPFPKRKAIQMNFDLKEGGWAGMSRNISGSTISQVRGLNLSYYGLDKKIDLQLILGYEDGTSFGYTWELEPGNKWAGLEALFEEFTRLKPDISSNPADQKLDPNKIVKLEIVCRLDKEDSHGTGRIIIDHIRGVMNIPSDSPWARAEEERETAIAINLASQSEQFAGTSINSLNQKALLAVESARHSQTWQGDLALRHVLSMLPEPLVRLNHSACVESVTFSPDGKMVATASVDKTAQLWDVATGKELYRLLHNGSVNYVAFSPDSKMVATASVDKTVRLWDVATGKELYRLLHNDSVNYVAFSPDGKMVATASWDKTARLWDVATGKELYRLLHNDSVNYVAFSPDGKMVATASVDKTAQLWDVATGKELHMLCHNGDVRFVTFNHNGTTVATASEDETARIWNVTTGQELHRLYHDGSVHAVAFSPDDEKVATACQGKPGTAELCLWDTTTGRELYRHCDASVAVAFVPHIWSVTFSPDDRAVAGTSFLNMIQLWDVATGNELYRLPHYDQVNYVAFSPDDKTIATASNDNTAALWDFKSHQEPHQLPHDSWVISVAFSPDGKTMATASGDSTARLWDVESCKELYRLYHGDFVWDVAFSKDGKKLVTASSDNTARIWDVVTGKELNWFHHWGAVWYACFSPDGKIVATASDDGTTGVWDIESGLELYELLHNGSVNYVAFSPNGKILATASDDKTARLWNIVSGKELHQLPHNDDVKSVTFSPDGRIVATTSQDNTTRLWDVATGKELYRLYHNSSVWYACFSPDGKTVATASTDKTARIWDVESGQELRRLPHDDEVLFVTFSPDNKTVATASHDNTARIWDAKTGRELHRLPHNSWVYSVIFSPNGKMLATTSEDGYARVWTISSQDLIKMVCSRVTRNLTKPEWRIYGLDESKCKTCSQEGGSSQMGQQECQPCIGNVSMGG